MNLFAVFLTGLLAGGLSCLAVQGGLLTATLAQTEEEKIRSKGKGDTFFPILAFLSAKLIAYTILGLVLGFLGSAIQFSVTTQVLLQLFVVIFMVGTALNLLQVHPIFRYFSLQPPRFLTRMVKNQSRSKSLFAPAILGAFTVLIPCGVTQAMMILAIGTGSALAGAAIMFAFVLGTSPIFFALGFITTKLGDALQQKFMKVAAVFIILLAFFNLTSALSLAGFDLPQRETPKVEAQTAIEEATITIGPGGYSPTSLTVKANSKVTLHLNNIGGGGCAAAFTIPKYGLQKIVPEGSTETISFIAPGPNVEFPFVCSMGMYRGVIRVI